MLNTTRCTANDLLKKIANSNDMFIQEFLLKINKFGITYYIMVPVDLVLVLIVVLLLALIVSMVLVLVWTLLTFSSEEIPWSPIASIVFTLE